MYPSESWTRSGSMGTASPWPVAGSPYLPPAGAHCSSCTQASLIPLQEATLVHTSGLGMDSLTTQPTLGRLDRGIGLCRPGRMFRGHLAETPNIHISLVLHTFQLDGRKHRQQRSVCMKYYYLYYNANCFTEV